MVDSLSASPADAAASPLLAMDDELVGDAGDDTPSESRCAAALCSGASAMPVVARAAAAARRGDWSAASGLGAVTTNR